jgi:drug/metabolite transporter (DMT)-like permease
MNLPSTSFRSTGKGYFYVLCAAMLWSVSGSTSKYLFLNGISPFQLSQLRVTLSALFLFLFFLIRHPHLLRISRNDIFYFFILGTFGMAAIQITYLFTISKLNVAAAILLEYLAPIFIALYMAVFAKEKLSRTTILAIIGATLGCYLVVGAYNLNLLNMNMAGIASGLASAVTFAWWSLHGEYGMRRYNPWTVLFYAMLFAATDWNIIYPPLKGFFDVSSSAQWGIILYITVMGTIIPFGLYYEGISLIRAARASITATLEPILAGVISYIFLDEIMSPMQIFGGVLVIAAIILLQIRQAYDDKAPSVIRARLNPPC